MTLREYIKKGNITAKYFDIDNVFNEIIDCKIDDLTDGDIEFIAYNFIDMIREDIANNCRMYTIEERYINAINFIHDNKERFHYFKGDISWECNHSHDIESISDAFKIVLMSEEMDRIVSEIKH
jgi:hypothetical protein